MVGQAVEQVAGEAFFTEGSGPFVERQCSDPQTLVMSEGALGGRSYLFNKGRGPLRNPLMPSVVFGDGNAAVGQASPLLKIGGHCQVDQARVGG